MPCPSALTQVKIVPDMVGWSGQPAALSPTTTMTRDSQDSVAVLYESTTRIPFHRAALTMPVSQHLCMVLSEFVAGT